MTITLRPHQREAVNAMWQNDKGQVIIPTGGGKTICMIDDAITTVSYTHLTLPTNREV